MPMMPPDSGSPLPHLRCRGQRAQATLAAMPTSRSGKSRPSGADMVFTPKRKSKPAPHAFVLDALEGMGPMTRPMFGCLAVYVEEKIVLILRDKGAADHDN